jgi:two-component system phosphate regulon sensor histidine kinase PhoR
LLQNQFDKNKIPLQFVFNHLKSDTIFYSTKDSLVSKKFSKEISSKSTYLKKDEKFQLLYNNSNTEALKRSVFGIFLSLLLSLAVISSLFYLLKIIRQQKELAEIKNDLISNITHEFKTPIATVAAALEALENFNASEDKEKTKKYVSISSIQLKKLHQMVEKLLETATLDSEQLLLKKEPHDMVALIDQITQKHRNLAVGTTLNFSTNSDFLAINIDIFHFENAISNLIDNAVKYGGSIIEVRINVLSNTIEISVKDNGNGIGKSEQEKIFDKFYRVSKGNTHDVKGFGIGLYYSKKIIEKHNGTIRLVSNSKSTIFKITLPK